MEESFSVAVLCVEIQQQKDSFFMRAELAPAGASQSGASFKVNRKIIKYKYVQRHNFKFKKSILVLFTTVDGGHQSKSGGLDLFFPFREQLDGRLYKVSNVRTLGSDFHDRSAVFVLI